MTQTEAEWLLAECRRKIDALDLDLRGLLNQRAEIACEIRRTKQVLAMAVHQPKREDEVLQKITERNPGPLSGDALRRIFECIMREIRAHEADHR